MRFSLLLATACWVFTAAASAQTPAAPQAASAAPQAVSNGLPALANAQRTVLTVQGPKGKRSWSLQQLEGLGLQRLTTQTFWPDDNGTYEGVLLSAVLQASGLEHAPFVRVAALDGFSQRIPRADWGQWPIMLATRKDGKAISTRNKGPLRIIYPRDMSPELSNSLYRLRWVWLVNQIDTQGQ